MAGVLAFAGAVPVVRPSSFCGQSVDRKPGQALTAVPTAQLKFPKLPSFQDLTGAGNKPAAASPAPTPATFAPVPTPAATAPASAKSASSPKGNAVPKGVNTSVKFYSSKTAGYVFRADAKGHGNTAFDSRVGGPDAGTNARANANSTFRNMDSYTSNPVWARAEWSPSEADVATRAVFRNVLGNAHIVEEEVAELATEISCFKETGHAKEFVRAVALSEAYKSRYFEPMTNMRFVELNFKHFLGRAPKDQAEIAEHMATLLNEGYNAEISSYFDSDEYDCLWGDQRVPQPNFRGGHDYNQGMNTLATLRGGFARSDRSTTSAMFAAASNMGCSPLSITKGLPEAWRGENAARDAAGMLREFPACFWNPVKDDLASAGGVDWMARMGVTSRNWYADSAIFKDVMKPQLKHSEREEADAAATLKYGSTMGKSYVGHRFQWSTAPVLEFKRPSSADASNGSIAVEMKEIEFSIPSELSQKV